mmetsp:Transcript_28474/g.64231  ORF Transcript_28474/g.64231 Transcript_28474/m.64231 type:complete len:264 (+) Transcript_28474:459-1250(+)
MRRGDRPHREPRGTAGQAPPQAAVPRGRRRVRLPVHRHERRDRGGRPHHPQEGGVVVRRLRKSQQQGHQALRNIRARQEPHGRGGVDVHPSSGAHREALRGDEERVEQPPGVHPRRFVRARPQQGAVRRGPHGVRRPPLEGFRPGHRRRHHVRRHGGHGRGHPPPLPLLQARELRPVHAVPGGHVVARGHTHPDGEGRRRQAGDTHARGDQQADRGPYHLRARGRRGLAGAGPAQAFQEGHRGQDRRPRELRRRQGVPACLVR